MCQVTEWVTSVREEVKRQLPPGTENVDQVLMEVQETLVADLLKSETDLGFSSRVIQESDFAEVKENILKERESSSISLGEEWQEKRFLRFFRVFF